VALAVKLSLPQLLPDIGNQIIDSLLEFKINCLIPGRYLIPCYARDPQINQCLRRTLQYLFKQLSRESVRQANLPRIDRIYVEDPAPYITNFGQINVYDLVVLGLSNIQIVDVRTNLNVFIQYYLKIVE
jgi:hypothetical protein